MENENISGAGEVGTPRLQWAFEAFDEGECIRDWYPANDVQAAAVGVLPGMGCLWARRRVRMLQAARERAG